MLLVAVDRFQDLVLMELILLVVEKEDDPITVLLLSEVREVQEVDLLIEEISELVVLQHQVRVQMADHKQV